MNESEQLKSENKLRARIYIDAGRRRKNFTHPWTYIGYDECNWTYRPDGKALLAKLGKLKDASYFIRTHHLLCSGNGLSLPKWGSTNVYREDKKGNSVYDWATIDRIFNTYLRTGCKPFVEIGFMPEDLSVKRGEEESWRYPPKNYHKWYKLISQLVKHCVDQYGKEEVNSWYWELWNEPDLSYYWRGSLEEYCKLYDYTAAAVKNVLPSCRIGGPATTNPANPKAGEWLDHFLHHCVEGINYYTGRKGAPLDFISFHAKGGNFPRDLKATKQVPSVKRILENIREGLEIITRYRELFVLPCILSECDTDGMAAYSVSDNPNLFFRNTEYYPAFVACMIKKIMDLNENKHANIRGILTWAFYFETEEYFKGFRSLTTHDIDKPILNLFRMYSLMGNTCLKLESDSTQNPLQFEDMHGTNQPSDIDGLAFMSKGGKIQVMIWNHHDDWEIKQETQVEVKITNLPFSENEVVISHHRIDQFNSNSYTEWKRQGSPRKPSYVQIKSIKSREGLKILESKEKCHLINGNFRKTVFLPPQSISLLEVSATSL